MPLQGPRIFLGPLRTSGYSLTLPPVWHFIGRVRLAEPIDSFVTAAMPDVSTLRTPLTPTQRVVLAERLQALRRARKWNITQVEKGVLRSRRSGVLSLLERGRLARAPREHIRRLADAYETTDVALLAVPAHILTFDDTFLADHFDVLGWRPRLARLTEAFGLLPSDVQIALAQMMQAPGPTYTALMDDGVSAGRVGLQVLSQLTGLEMGWLCLGSRMPLLPDVERPQALPLVPTAGEDTRHDLEGWTSANSLRAARYLKR